MDRRPVVAGQFYPGTQVQLEAQVRDCLSQGGPKASDPTMLAMVPHAGYVFSGSVAGKTLARANLAGTVLLLGPNHTGLGGPFSLWAQGRWLIPGGVVHVDTALAQALAKAEPRLTPDREGHVREHSLEVLLPFLHSINPDIHIVPLAVAEPVLEVLLGVARKIAGVLRKWEQPVSIVVSSDMSHYITHELATEKDKAALEKIVALDPEELFRVVRRDKISMCGVLPMTLGLAVCRELGARQAEITAYATSGEVSGDYDRVVGYAGALVF